MSKLECARCGHAIDRSARLCPFCGADPETGRKLDTVKLVEADFPRKRDLPAKEKAVELFRERQGIAVTLLLLGMGLLAILVQQTISRRNAAKAADAPGVPLTELADIRNRAPESAPAPMPDLTFSADGDPRRVRTLLLEPGAIAPAPSPTASPSQAQAVQIPTQPGVTTPPAAIGPRGPAARPTTAPLPQRSLGGPAKPTPR